MDDYIKCELIRRGSPSSTIGNKNEWSSQSKNDFFGYLGRLLFFKSRIFAASWGII